MGEAESSLKITLIQQYLENLRYFQTKMAQGAVIFLGISGYSFNIVFGKKLESDFLVILSLLNISFSIGLCCYTWLLDKIMISNSEILCTLIEDEPLRKPIPNKFWIRFLTYILSFFVIVAIALWTNFIVSGS